MGLPSGEAEEEVMDRVTEKMDAAERARLATADQLELDRRGRAAMFPDQMTAKPYRLPAKKKDGRDV